MNKNNNILSSDLQSFAVLPPSFLFEQIKNKIDGENNAIGYKLKSLFDHSVTPPIVSAASFGSILNKIKQTDQLNQFKPLRDYEIAAPFSFAKLMEIIRNSMAAMPSISKARARVIPINTLKKVAVAAAILALCYFGYNTFIKTSTSNANPDIANTINNNTTPIIDNNIPTSIDTSITTIPNTSNQIASIVGNRKQPLNYNALSNKPTNNQKRKKEFSKNIIFRMGKETAPTEAFNIGGSSVPIIDNDYLATFASLNETNLPPFLQAEKPLATTIKIDDYTDITISENMGAMMKKMYKTKKSGKPTRRARKTKEKLEKWKIADSTFFNPNTLMNALDPFDLGNFILTK